MHDLKHTFGRRLRAAGVSIEDRHDLLGHRSGRITTHYSSAELHNLHAVANKVCEQKRSGMTLTMLCNRHRQEALKNVSDTVATSSLQKVRQPNGHKLATGHI